MDIKEKSHRLPKTFYKGDVSAAFALCLKGDLNAGFSLHNREMVSIFTNILTSVIARTGCIVPVYCFMPDHQHLIIQGTQNHSDIWKTITSYKQKSGFWMKVNNPIVRWQKDFYDHVIRRYEDMATQIKYVLDNPVRKGLVSYWHEYPFQGSIGCRIEDVLGGIL